MNGTEKPAVIEYRSTAPTRRVLLVLLLLSLAALGAAPAEKKPKGRKIAVTTHLDKTAVWVGDVLGYTVRVVHDPDIEIVLDPLKRESLNLAPFVVRDVTVRQSPFGENRRMTEVIFQLSTYESGQSELRIPAFMLYYFALKNRPEKGGDTPAESLSVPTTRVGLRSTLSGDVLRPRDERIIWQDNMLRWMVAFPLGLAGMLFLGVHTARRLWASASPEKPAKRRLTRGVRGRMLRGFLRSMQSIERDSAEDHLRFYAEVSGFVRQYLGEWLEADVASLTPGEVARVLENYGHGGLGEPVKTILEKCEQVLYTRHGADLAKNWHDEVQEELAKLAQRLRV
jgi:hypothetical protein